MKHTVKLHPRFLGPELMKHLDKELIRSVEGTCAGSMGYIVCVTKVLERGEVRRKEVVQRIVAFPPSDDEGVIKVCENVI